MSFVNLGQHSAQQLSSTHAPAGKGRVEDSDGEEVRMGRSTVDACLCIFGAYIQNTAIAWRYVLQGGGQGVFVEAGGELTFNFHFIRRFALNDIFGHPNLPLLTRESLLMKLWKWIENVVCHILTIFLSRKKVLEMLIHCGINSSAFYCRQLKLMFVLLSYLPKACLPICIIVCFDIFLSSYVIFFWWTKCNLAFIFPPRDRISRCWGCTEGWSGMDLKISLKFVCKHVQLHHHLQAVN